MWKTALPYYYDISYPDKKGYTKHMLDISSELTYRLYKAGCPLLIGTDTNIAGTYVGETTWLEMELFVKAGIPVYETLRSATVLPARALGKEKETGTIEVGKRANLIVLNKNPLEDISHIRALELVYSNGYLVKSKSNK
jgi:imidazolonepropionase-like amidohydrolase